VSIILNRYSSTMPIFLIAGICAIPIVLLVAVIWRHEKEHGWIRRKFFERPISYSLLGVAFLPFFIYSTAILYVHLKDTLIPTQKTAKPTGTGTSSSGIQQQQPTAETTAAESMQSHGAAKNKQAKPSTGKASLQSSSNPPPAQSAPSPLPSSQQCALGANCAQSVGQVGGITAGQVNIGVHDWEPMLSGDKQNALISALKQVHGKYRLTWIFQDVSGMKMARFLNYAFAHADWTPDQPENYAGNMCYPTKPSDCIGLIVAVKDRKSESASAAIDAISAFIPDAQIGEDSKVPDGRVDIFIARAK
jgi:hypothetical protein